MSTNNPQEWQHKSESACEICGKPLVQPKMGRKRLTCSNACRQKYHREKVRYMRWKKIDRGEVDRKELKRIAAAYKRKFPKMDAVTGSHIRLGGEPNFCKWCGTPFVGELRQHYCEPGCARKARKWAEKMIGMGFYSQPRPGQDLDWHLESMLRRGLKVPFCPVCGDYFEPELESKRGRPRIFCSVPCRQKYQNKLRPVKHCQMCGKGFRQKTRTAHQLYCSEACKAEAWRVRHGQQPQALSVGREDREGAGV